MSAASTAQLRWIATLATAVVLTGCSAGAGGGGGRVAPSASATATTTSPALRLAAAADNVSKAATARFTLRTEVTIGSAPPSITTATGQMDIPARAIAMHLDVREAGETMSMDEVILEERMYLRGLPGVEKTWYELSSSELAAFGGGGGVGGNPDELTERVRDAAGLREVGPERVNGVATTKYTGSVDLKAVARRQGAGAAGIQRSMSVLGVSQVPLEAWVDGQNRIVRLITTLDTPTGTHLVTSMDYSHWGEPVSIRKPAGVQPFSSIGLP